METKRYASDLTDEEWSAVEPFLPKGASAGGPRRVDLREVLSAPRHLVRSGCGWRMLPAGLPRWQAAYWWFRRLTRRLMFKTIRDVALMVDRARVGRGPGPGAAAIDSQTAKAPAAHGTRGYGGAKRTVGRKRHIAVDAGGRPLMVNLATAGTSDSAGARALPETIHTRWRRARHLLADGAHDERQPLDKAGFLGFTLEAIKRTEAAFVASPRRWAVERTLGRMTRHRRLVRDHEAGADVSEAMIDIATGGLLIRRLAHP